MSVAGWRWLPTALVASAAVASLLYGPLAQAPGYNDFADRRFLCGVANGGDVWSNLGFLMVGLWGCWVLRSREARDSLGAAFPGYAVFVAALVLTAAGSAYYHLTPDNARLVWDRVPIAIACAGLLAGARAQTVAPSQPRWGAYALAAFGVASVCFWSFTGDLRPYVILQGAPLVVIPIWQAIARAPRRQRIGMAAAVLLYIAAKAAEMNDRQVFGALGFMSGHTLKHLLAAAASLALVGGLIKE